MKNIAISHVVMSDLKKRTGRLSVFKRMLGCQEQHT